MNVHNLWLNNKYVDNFVVVLHQGWQILENRENREKYLRYSEISINEILSHLLIFVVIIYYQFSKNLLYHFVIRILVEQQLTL